MHDIVKKYAAVNWEDFDDSLEDFEARNFAYTYELIGQFVREGVVDLSTVSNALQFLVVIDWEVFSPLADHLKKGMVLRLTPGEIFNGLQTKPKKG